jgi:hypothetical protein
MKEFELATAIVYNATQQPRASSGRGQAVTCVVTASRKSPQSLIRGLEGIPDIRYAALVKIQGSPLTAVSP